MESKIQKFLHRNRYIFASFFSAAGVMLVMYIILGMTPFGENTILRMDLYHQYGPLFAELFEKIKSHGSFSYSWVSGLGSCFLGNYFNYLSSPLGAIVLLFGHAHVPQAIAVMILLKVAFASGAFTYYLKKSQRNQSAVTVMFGIFYAFCGYVLAYYWNVMWLDAVALFPLIILGIERIIDNGKIRLYVSALALSMFSNYYMSFMLCLFAVVYFIYYYAMKYPAKAVLSKKYEEKHPKGIVHAFKNRRFLRAGVLFALGSLLAAGLIAFALLPTYNVLRSCSATDNPFPNEIKTYFNSFDFLVNHLSSLTTTIRSSGDDVLPNVYCGMLTLILAPLYFFTRSISKKEKLSTLILLAFFYISFNFNYLNFIWHGFHFPNDLPYRFSFMYSFILVLMAYKTFMRLNEFSSRQIAVVGAALIFTAFLTEKIQSKNFTQATFYISIAFVVVYVLMLTVFKSKKYELASLAVLLCVCACSEVIVADTNSISSNIRYMDYASDYQEFTDIKKQLDAIEDGKFYRMELTDLRTRMDPSWYNYNGVSVFSSMAYEKLARLQNHMGLMSNDINSYTYNPQTPVYNMMHSLKYIVNNEVPNVLSEPYYTRVAAVGKYTAYRNKYFLPIAFCVSNDVNDWNYFEDNVITDPFEVQGDFFSKATGLETPFERLPIAYVNYTNTNPFIDDIDGSVIAFSKTVADTDASATFNVTTEKTGNVYIYYNIDGASDKDVVVNSSVGTITHNAGRDSVLDLGRYGEGETISVTIPFEKNSGNMRFYAYTLNDRVLEKGYKRLNENVLNVEKFEDTLIEGSFTAKENCLLYTSIPYDKGWNVTLDGKPLGESDIVSVGGALIGIKAEKGSHEIRFEYKPTGLAAGISISSIALAAVLIYFLLKKLRPLPFTKLPRFTPVIGGYSERVIFDTAKRMPRVPAYSEAVSIKAAHERKWGSVKCETIVPPKKDEPHCEVIAPPNFGIGLGAAEDAQDSKTE